MHCRYRQGARHRRRPRSASAVVCRQWRRYVAKSGGHGQSGQAINLFQILPYVNDFQTLNLTACMRLEKLVLPSIFDINLSFLTMWNLQSYTTTVLNERTWHFYGVKTYSDPSYIFSGGQDPATPGSRPSVQLSWTDSTSQTSPALSGAQTLACSPILSR